MLRLVGLEDERKIEGTKSGAWDWRTRGALIRDHEADALPGFRRMERTGNSAPGSSEMVPPTT